MYNDVINITPRWIFDLLLQCFPLIQIFHWVTLSLAWSSLGDIGLRVWVCIDLRQYLMQNLMHRGTIRVQFRPTGLHR